jgi:hypothetical protein
MDIIPTRAHRMATTGQVGLLAACSSELALGITVIMGRAMVGVVAMAGTDEGDTVGMDAVGMATTVAGITGQALTDTAGAAGLVMVVVMPAPRSAVVFMVAAGAGKRARIGSGAV